MLTSISSSLSNVLSVKIGCPLFFWQLLFLWGSFFCCFCFGKSSIGLSGHIRDHRDLLLGHFLQVILVYLLILFHWFHVLVYFCFFEFHNRQFLGVFGSLTTRQHPTAAVSTSSGYLVPCLVFYLVSLICLFCYTGICLCFHIGLKFFPAFWEGYILCLLYLQYFTFPLVHITYFQKFRVVPMTVCTFFLLILAIIFSLEWVFLHICHTLVLYICPCGTHISGIWSTTRELIYRVLLIVKPILISLRIIGELNVSMYVFIKMVLPFLLILSLLCSVIPFLYSATSISSAVAKISFRLLITPLQVFSRSCE